MVSFTKAIRAPTEVPTARENGKPTAKDKLHAELISYAWLPQGWDGYDGKPAQLQAVTDAIAFLDLKPADIPLPYPQIAPDGEVGLYWRTDEVYADVGFYGNSEFSYYARYTPLGRQVTEDGRDHCSLKIDAWPEGLLLILNKLDR